MYYVHETFTRKHSEKINTIIIGYLKENMTMAEKTSSGIIRDKTIDDELLYMIRHFF